MVRWENLQKFREVNTANYFKINGIKRTIVTKTLKRKHVEKSLHCRDILEKKSVKTVLTKEITVIYQKQADLILSHYQINYA